MLLRKCCCLGKFLLPDFLNALLWLQISRVLSEMGICGDNLSAIVIGDLLPIKIIIAKNSFDLLITNIVFVIYFAMADKLLRKTIHHAHSV